MLGKAEAALITAWSYFGAFLVSREITDGDLTGSIAVTEPHLFWPSFAGAGLAALFTIAPLFDDAQTAPKASRIAFKAAVSITAGFVLAYFAGDWIHGRVFTPVLPEFPREFALVLSGFVGEKLFTFIYNSNPKDWWDWLSSLRPGGKL